MAAKRKRDQGRKKRTRVEIRRESKTWIIWGGTILARTGEAE